MNPVATPFSIKDFFKSFMLLELFKGMALTGRYAFRRKVTVMFPEEKTRLACLAPLRKRRGTLHCLQIVRGHLPGDGHHYRVHSAGRWHAPHHAL